jgi:N-acyl-D-amino-acid deacylase
MNVDSFDLVIRNGTVFDGTGSPGRRADVAVRDGRITAIGQIHGAAATVVDATGLAVTPGFIDVHTHDDLAVLVETDVPYKVMQGVTTDIVGNCGFGVAPFSAAIDLFKLLGPQPAIEPWQGFGGYIDRLASTERTINVGVLMGHGSIRAGVMSRDKRSPTTSEVDAMRRLVIEGMEAGALGLSTGLVYEPGRYASTGEIVAIAQDVGAAGGVYASHIRNDSGSLLPSIEEAIRIGSEAGVGVQISHHKVTGRPNWGMVKKSLGLIEEAQRAGLDVTADQYPYTASSTSLAAYYLNGSFELQDGVPRSGPTDVAIASAPAHPEWEGRWVADLMQEIGSDFDGTLRHIIDAEGSACTAIVFSMDEADIETVLAHPSTMIGSDGIPSGGKPHPRLYGTFPRILGRYVRERGVLDFATAIHKMTGMPAAKFQLAARGLLQPGYWGDIVILDPDRIAETSTYEEPRSYPAGLRDVFVNGVAVVRNDTLTGARPGKALRRGDST